MNIRKLNLIFCFLILLSACRNQDSSGLMNDPNRKIRVVAEKSQLIREITGLQYSGTVEASQTIPLSFQVPGRVEKVLADAGDEVQKGQLLATLDKSDLQNLYEITQAKYEQAQDAYDRLKTVHDGGSLPEIKWVEMSTNLEQAKLSMDLSRNNLDKCNLRSPASGLIGRRNIEPGMSTLGSLAAPFELVDINTVEIRFSVPENEIGKIRKGILATFTVSALGDKQFSGEVTKVNPVADFLSRTYEAKISVKNPGHELKPGMICDVSLSISSEREMVLISYQSVTKDNEGNAYVYVVNPQTLRVKKQVIRPGNYHGNLIEVLSGLAPDQIVVKEGKEKLSDNCLISM